MAQNISQSGIPFPCPSVQKALKCIFFAKCSEIIAALLFISGSLVSKKTKGDTWCFSHILLLVPGKGSIWSATSPHKSEEVPSLTNSYPLLKRPYVFNLYTFKLFQSALFFSLPQLYPGEKLCQVWTSTAVMKIRQSFSCSFYGQDNDFRWRRLNFWSFCYVISSESILTLP